MFRLGCVIAVSCYAAIACCADENPFKSAKVGDWIEYAHSSDETRSVLRRTVTATSVNEVTIEELWKSGTEVKRSTFSVDLTRAYHPVKYLECEEDSRTIEYSGEEQLKLNGKEFRTSWFTFVSRPWNIKFKAWFSSDLPLDGMVKQEMVLDDKKRVLELTGFEFANKRVK
jgi:hypothetical protein